MSQLDSKRIIRVAAFLAALVLPAMGLSAGEAELVLPNLNMASFGGVSAVPMLEIGMLICVLGGLFGLV
ncbi:MAG TPA: hypothetical protein VMC79_09535, partial [Rectinemataceae bacterium]|nr:hypothetical protein [Rectinemataceae bacterium]